MSQDFPKVTVVLINGTRSCIKWNYRQLSSVHLWWMGQSSLSPVFIICKTSRYQSLTFHRHLQVCQLQRSVMLLHVQVSINSSQHKPVVEAGQHPLMHLCAPVPATDLMSQFCQSITMKVLTYQKTFRTRQMVSISIQFYIHIWKILQVTTQNKCFNWYDVLNYLKKIIQWKMWENSIVNT